jgi:hypothetical protein
VKQQWESGRGKEEGVKGKGGRSKVDGEEAEEGDR